MHTSVLLKEAVDSLNLNSKSIVVDCTLGYGGHSSLILKTIKEGHLYAFDQDEEAIKSSQERLSKIASNYTIIKDNFKNIKVDVNKDVDAILFDLGVSSPQLDEDNRGFSFHKDAKLDMRMDLDNPLTAYDVVNTYPYNDLVRIFRDYGEEKYATSIAHKIVDRRDIKPIETTLELVDVIKSGVPEKYSREHHPARKVFQAIRIEVNDELNVLSIALDSSLDMLKVGGRLSVITFQSLEDKIVKNKFKEVSTIPDELKHLPIIPEEYEPKFKLIENIVPKEEEIRENNRARSARLRVIERIK
jgi:16S rRNA (cytosine1402-N4)-methyltransferase